MRQKLVSLHKAAQTIKISYAILDRQKKSMKELIFMPSTMC